MEDFHCVRISTEVSTRLKVREIVEVISCGLLVSILIAYMDMRKYYTRFVQSIAIQFWRMSAELSNTNMDIFSTTAQQ